LSQCDTSGNEHVIAYASRLLTKPERNYCVTRKELLAVVTFLSYFRHYLIGIPFTIRTDHGALTWLQNFRSPEGQLAIQLEKNFISVLYTDQATSTTMQTLSLEGHVTSVAGVRML